MSDESSTNSAPTPGTPKVSTLSLTEYAATPTPPNERSEQVPSGLHRDWQIPEAFLLPNGYPDVRSCRISKDYLRPIPNRLDS